MAVRNKFCHSKVRSELLGWKTEQGREVSTLETICEASSILLSCFGGEWSLAQEGGMMTERLDYLSEVLVLPLSGSDLRSREMKQTLACIMMDR